jgi:hydroxyacylglutathione hydrolase
MFEIIRIPAFKDNYIWLMHIGASAVVVDPGDASPVLEVLTQNRLRLQAILITHHHADHQGGIELLLQHYPAAVYGPSSESITGRTHPLNGGERIEPGALGVEFFVLAVPGHTLGHLAYYTRGILFCGDTLFSGGCGRVFEGSFEQMYTSLMQLSALPETTHVYCAHEYTEANLRFARAVEPHNRALQCRTHEVAALRSTGQATVPSTIADERKYNPFLRCAEKEVIAAARVLEPLANEGAGVFSVLRQWKNRF